MNFKLKLLGAAVLPVILISLASFWVIQSQSQSLAREQIAEIEDKTKAARMAELEKMNQLALSSIHGLYENSQIPEAIAKERAKARLSDMAFGDDSYFFVYDENGKNIVHPRLPGLVGRNLWDLQDPNGDYVIRNLIKVAKAGGGFHSYMWNQPSTGQITPKLGHAVFLEKWGWMIGTGLYTDDLDSELATMKAALSRSIDNSATVMIILSIAGVLLAALITWSIRLSEQRFADQRLKELTHRIVEVQEDERKRVSTELHDGISQMLVSARYRLDQAMSKVAPKSTAAMSLQKAMSTIENTISEVRRISMALRPSVLDDIGLAAALSSLTREFGEQSGIAINIDVVRLGKRLTSKAQTALYRVAQEALTNIAKHSDAKQVSLTLKAVGNHVCLQIEDDGKLHRKSGASFPPMPSFDKGGMGLRNMQERMDAFQGELDIRSSKQGGLLIEARVPFDKNWVLAQNDNPEKTKYNAA